MYITVDELHITMQIEDDDERVTFDDVIEQVWDTLELNVTLRSDTYCRGNSCIGVSMLGWVHPCDSVMGVPVEIIVSSDDVRYLNEGWVVEWDLEVCSPCEFREQFDM